MLADNPPKRGMRVVVPMRQHSSFYLVLPIEFARQLPSDVAFVPEMTPEGNILYKRLSS